MEKNANMPSLIDLSFGNIYSLCKMEQAKFLRQFFIMHILKIH